MRFNLTSDPLVDFETTTLPINDGVEVTIYRAGIPAYMRRTESRQRAVLTSAMGAYLKRKGKTLADAMGTGLDVEEMLSEVQVSDVDMEIFDTPEPADIAVLVKQCQLPVVDDDGTKRLVAWRELIAVDCFDHAHNDCQVCGGSGTVDVPAGAHMLELMPRMKTWVLQFATELQARYAAVLKAAEGNSPTTSDGSTTPAVVETPTS